jgi:predicted site-specific integrase-resolvase
VSQAEEFLTVGEACQMLHISRATLYRMLKRGDLAGVRVLRIPPPDGDLRLSKQDLIKKLEAGPLPAAEDNPL